MNKLNQYATFSGLKAGNYDGLFKLDEVIKGNNFGIGTFEDLDGEMVGFDNHFYRMRSDGTVIPVKSKDLSPFASLMKFHSPIVLSLKPNSDMKALLKVLKDEINPNRIYALKITGVFSEISTRISPKQSKPYVKLATVLEKESVKQVREGEEGTIAGFFAPALYATILNEGFHLHFLNKEKNYGGHVVDFMAEEVKLEVVEIDEMELIFDSSKKEIEVSGRVV